MQPRQGMSWPSPVMQIFFFVEAVTCIHAVLEEALVFLDIRVFLKSHACSRGSKRGTMKLDFTGPRGDKETSTQGWED